MDDSALVEMLTAAGPVGSAVAARVAEADVLCAPHLLDTEVMSALLGMARGGKITSDQVDTAMAAYERLPIDRYDSLPLWPRVKVLRANLSAYDATYVALAETLGAVLVTSDARIARSGAARCPVEVFD
ncbi:type II toxin-antitoxin system VapC family toxin [Nocardiopsis lambiniae]|uniref:Ribonuclease VapC n=1 Tax=Nocardiopsis lambiniae TaxID=3075539 RepID=A0ABU2M5X9_9ACTN|nr:type II toxin-antitoxin system VapC family toxin [Nocardiopsis sp. DSM 44743]MDT0328069.1 type II toxin-antitoxin system VapC family toxin [Nocardiopsis sp. DSM 44743]